MLLTPVDTLSTWPAALPQLIEATYPHFVHGSGSHAPRMWWKVGGRAGGRAGRRAGGRVARWLGELLVWVMGGRGVGRRAGGRGVGGRAGGCPSIWHMSRIR